jgi:hypothetical protein
MTKPYGSALMVFSLICILLAIIGAFLADLWLASTQWLLIAGIFALYAIYLKI